MNSRTLLNLVLAALVAILFLFVWLKPKTTPSDEFKLSTLPSSSVNYIVIKRPGDLPTIELQKTPTGWRMVAPFQARSEGAIVDRLLSILTATSAQRFPATDLGRFQLDQPLLQLTLNDQEFSFGTQNTLTGEVYVTTLGGVYMVAPSYMAHALKSPTDFAAHSFLTEEEKPIGFEFSNLKLNRNNAGKWIESPAQPNWSQDDINRWTDEWRHASSLVTQPYDGTPPLESFTLKLDNGKLIPCKILRHEPELVILREDEKLQYHFPVESGRHLVRPVK